MKTIVLSIVALGMMSATASAAPAKLSKEQMSTITAGKITQVNKGGNVPSGQANGIPATNPAGKAPAGQNK